jgi:hypothetical protein
VNSTSEYPTSRTNGTKKKNSMRIPKAARELEKRNEVMYVKGMEAQQVSNYTRLQQRRYKHVLLGASQPSQQFAMGARVTREGEAMHHSIHITH